MLVHSRIERCAIVARRFDILCATPAAMWVPCGPLRTRCATSASLPHCHNTASAPHFSEALTGPHLATETWHRIGSGRGAPRHLQHQCHHAEPMLCETLKQTALLSVLTRTSAQCCRAGGTPHSSGGTRAVTVSHHRTSGIAQKLSLLLLALLQHHSRTAAAHRVRCAAQV